MQVLFFVYFVVRYRRRKPGNQMWEEVAQMGVNGYHARAGVVAGGAAFALNATLALSFIGFDMRAEDQGFEKYAGLWPLLVLVLAVICAPIMEEYFFRGFYQPRVARWLGAPWRGRLVVNIVWTLTHWSGGLTTLVVLFLPGMIFGWLRDRYASVWPAVIAHMMHNAIWAVFYLDWVLRTR